MIYLSNESYSITGAAMQVYNTLGAGFLEAVYQEALAIELTKRGIPYEREKDLKIYYDGQENSLQIFGWREKTKSTCINV